jgi:DNA-directed RNA polymerase subunit RPC12/RpoP
VSINYITYRCTECDNSTEYEVDLNLPDKDMTCPTCGHRITQGELVGGGEWRGVHPDSAAATGRANDATVVTEDGEDRPRA